MKKWIILFLFLWMAIFASVSHAANVETKSELYLYIERLSAYGLIDSAILGARPIDRREFARLIIEASRKAQDTQVPQNIRYILERLREEFGEEMKDTTASYVKPVREANLRYAHLKGKESAFPNIKASQEPFNYNNDGIALKSNNIFLDIKGDARYGPLSLYINPLLASDLNSQTLNLNKGYMKLYWGKFSFEIGKDSLWWGQGRHGSLILTNNAEPYKLLKISNEVPFNLPVLGLLRIDFFLSRLEKDRDIPEPFFGGLRLSIKPNPWLELGLTRTAITGGEGMPRLGLSDIGTIIIGKNLEGKEKGESNQIAGVDVRIRITPLKAYIYGEAAGEDEAGWLPYKWAYIAGVYFADILGADLRVEYANTAFQYPGWYTHGVYTSGYTYKGRLIGHHMGGDARDIFVSSSFFLDRSTKVSLYYDYEKRGVSMPDPEIHSEVMIQLQRDISKRMALGIRGGYERVKNSGHIPGREEENRLIEFSLKLNM